MTNDQKFAFDLKGYLLIPGALTADEIKPIKAQSKSARTYPETLPPRTPVCFWSTAPSRPRMKFEIRWSVMPSKCTYDRDARPVAFDGRRVPSVFRRAWRVSRKNVRVCSSLAQARHGAARAPTCATRLPISQLHPTHRPITPSTQGPAAALSE